MDDSLELLHLDINLRKSLPLQLVITYRPPAGSFDTFRTKISNYLNNINYCNLPTIIMGDLNVNILKNSPASTGLNQLLKLYNFPSAKAPQLVPEVLPLP